MLMKPTLSARVKLRKISLIFKNIGIFLNIKTANLSREHDIPLHKTEEYFLKGRFTERKRGLNFYR